jgi:tyrosinase
MGIRKDQAALTPAERAAFVAAVLALKAEGTYDVFVAQHRTAMQAGTNDPAHNGPAFLPWHREYLRRFERALQTVDPSVWLPYWDSTVNQFVTALPWTADFMGGNGSGTTHRVITGPFAFATGDWPLTVRDSGDTRVDLRRAFGQQVRILPSPDLAKYLNNVVPYDSAPWSYASDPQRSFRRYLEMEFDYTVHGFIGETMATKSSPNDPVFWLHHCNLDRLWAKWQLTHPDQTYVPSSGTSGVVAGHGLDDPMPPWNTESVPPTPRSVLDHHALGYSYDNEGPPVPRWESLGGAGTGVVVGGPGAKLETGGRLVVFARGTDNNIWHRWQVTRNGNWSGWESVGAPPGGATSDPDAALNDPGGLVVFARGTDNSIWHAWQSKPDGNWW